MLVSLVICTYNRDKYLTECLESIAKLDCKTEDYEVVVINNNSSDETKIICEAFEKRNQAINFRHELELNQGLSYARNKGIEVAKGHYLAFIDDDAILDKYYLKNIIFFIEHNEYINAIGGKIVPVFVDGRPKWVSKYLLPLFATLDIGDRVKKIPQNKFPVGANMIFKKSVFEKYGNFNVNLGRKEKNLEGGEEKDIFTRMRASGEILYYLPSALVYHQIPGFRTTKDFIIKQAIGIGKSEKTRTLFGKNRKSYYNRIIIEIAKWAYTIALFIFYCLKFQASKGTMLVRFRYNVTKHLV